MRDGGGLNPKPAGYMPANAGGTAGGGNAIEPSW